MGTTARNFRIDDELWHRAQQRAADEDTNVSELIRQWLGDYAAGAEHLAHRPEPTAEQALDDAIASLTALRSAVAGQHLRIERPR